MKVSGNLGSLVQGVSQQDPTERRQGQHGEQVNMVADPVRGLSRRQGSLYTAETVLDLDWAKREANAADAEKYLTYEFTYNGRDIAVLYRRRARDAGSDLPALLAYDKTNRRFFTMVRNTVDAGLDLLDSGGVSAITAVGKYLFVAGNASGLYPSAGVTNVWSGATNQGRTVAWVRGGAYSRTYTATVTKTDNSQVTFAYTTPASSYGGVLDTSGVPVYAADPAGGTTSDTEAAYITAAGSYGEATLGWASWSPTSLVVKQAGVTLTNVSPSNPSSASEYRWDAGAATVRFHSSLVGALDVSLTYTHDKTIANPNYTKTVADLTNAYNSAVTAWIGSSSAAVQPEAIAEELKDAAIAAGLTGVTRVGSTVVFTGVKEITTNDGGDGTLFKGVANTVKSVADLTDAHYVGKIVQVSPGGGESFYMKATAKNPSITSGVTEVVWVEGAARDITANLKLIYCVPDSTSMYVASSATLLDAILPDDHPEYTPSTVGDADTQPTPHFFGKKINYLGFFQDRLLVGADSVVTCSKTGDYLNFFRSTVLSQPADDPVVLTSQGQERDVIVFSVLYDKDLILFGRRQYVLSGRSPLTPTNAVMPVIGNHAGADDAPPESAGGVVFYAKRAFNTVSVMQLEPGRNAESPESYPVSSQLDDYLSGLPVELMNVSSPATLLMRTRGTPHSLYVFSYLESREQRLQDCWHRWDYDESLGAIMGLSQVDEGVLIFYLRQAADEDGIDRQYLVVDRQPLLGKLSSRPYLDGQRDWSLVVSDPGQLHPESVGKCAAYLSSSDHYLMGVDDLADVPDLLDELGDENYLVVGTPMVSYWTPTNPMYRRGEEVVKSGRMVVSFLHLQYADCAGFRSVVESYGQTFEFTFNGRKVGESENLVGRVPISDGSQSVGIGRANTEYTQTIHALSWLPLRITAVSWTGQLFNRPQFVG